MHTQVAVDKNDVYRVRFLCVADNCIMVAVMLRDLCESMGYSVRSRCERLAKQIQRCT
jgi:hypothetical protein